MNAFEGKWDLARVACVNLGLPGIALGVVLEFGGCLPSPGSSLGISVVLFGFD